MANSKANIYPVKLQGAELNLNKFDAEIKQYSGFNKNNAPFVGGCLSPIFNKKDTSYPFDKNTYVDKNGDVYYLETNNQSYNYLMKNNKVVMTLSKTGYDVIECENIPINAIWVLDEDFYITAKRNGFFLNAEGSSVDIIDLYNRAKLLHIETQSCPGISDVVAGKFNLYKKTISNVETIFVIGNVETQGKYYYSICVAAQKINGEWDFYNRISAIGNSVEISDGFFNTPTAQFTGSTISDFKIWFFINGANDYCCCEADYFNNYFSGFYFALHSRFNSTKYHYFTEDKKVHVIGNAKAIQIVNYDFDNIAITYSNYRTVTDITGQSSYWQTEDNILTPWGCVWAARFDTSTKEINLGVVGNKIHPYATYNATEGRTINAVGCVFNDVVLINNGVISGICLPSANILVTEWNSVDGNYVFFGENTTSWRVSKYYCLWKDVNSGKFYKLVRSDVKMIVYNDQIIFNVSDYRNSYRITDGKTLCYAPAWNNRYPFISDSNLTSKNINSVPDEYFASSINEYDLQDNASIILNPVLIKAAWNYNARLRSIVLSNAEGLCCNFYKGTDNAVYWYSRVINGSKYREGAVYKLIDLPFPSDTNGNIQYSPSLFSKVISAFGNDMFININNNVFQLMKINNATVFSFYMATMIENLSDAFILQGQYYVIINNVIYSATFSDGVIQNTTPVVSVLGLKYCGNTPYQAFFFSKTNKCIYVFNGSNVLQQMQFVDKYDDINFYKYNPATQSIFLITDNDVLVYSAFGIFTIDVPGVIDLYLLDDGICLLTDKLTFVKYYLDNIDTDFEKVNIDLETCFYGSNNELVTVNDCLYVRLFDEEHEEGKIVISATTLTNEGRETDKTTFNIRSSDWDKMTHSIYLRYQPKYQRGLGISFKINSPFKIASLSVGNVPDTILIDKVSKGAINAPQKTTTSKWT